MRIAYFSPLNPLKTGVADYSEELLPELAKHVDIDIYITNFEPTSQVIKQKFKFFSINSFNEEKYKYYDEVIYHIGNNTEFHKDIYLTALKFPGIVVIHDYSIHHLIANLTVGKGDWEGYINEMKYNYGEEGEHFARLSAQGKMRVMWESDRTLEYPANRRLLECSRGAIVHSYMAEESLKTVKPNQFIQYAPLFATNIESIRHEQKLELRKKYNISENAVVFSSFGFVSKAKRIESVLKALKKLSPEKEVVYLVVGQEEEGAHEISNLIKQLKLDNICRHVGFVSLEEFKEYIMLSDVCINLRYPTQGETSASLLRILGYGKPALVSDIGSFSEFPDNFTIKISCGDEQKEINEIAEALDRFLKDENLASVMGLEALSYVERHHTVSETSASYIKAIQMLHAFKAFGGEARYYYGYLDRYFEKVGDIISLSEENKRNFSEKLSEFFR